MSGARIELRPALRIRPLASGDLGAVIVIDAALNAQPRRAYFERRLAAAQRAPGLHVQLGALQEGVLCGFALARVLEGEFGRTEPALRLEAIGVKPVAQGRGFGAKLGAALEEEARFRGIKELRSTASWRSHAMLRFLDRGGWSLAQSRVLDCALAEVELGSGAENARDAVEIALLVPGDLEGMVRIDRRLTGRDRTRFLERALAEALEGSSIRVSLAARADGALAGFVMARMDLGDFGRAEPVAVIDAVGVDPLRARQGFGRALLSQLFVNLAALGVERVETVVAPGQLDLLGFFYRAGLRPAERLAFVKPLA